MYVCERLWVCMSQRKCVCVYAYVWERKRVREFASVCGCLRDDPIYPTPPLGQDMTHGQFLSGV